MSPPANAPGRTTASGGGFVLGVLVPCRDESAVIVRKLLNLARADWPRAQRPHRVVVVDDGSRDGTAALAAQLGPQLSQAGLTLEVAHNDARPGKPGAIACGLRRLAGTVDLVVLTDADVVLEPGALCALTQAFAQAPPLGLACGAQRFVRELASDGRARAPDGSPARPAAGLYDRLTARVRRLESRAGRLVSVHGELLAWRAELALAPTPGFAADDLDLMLQARLAGWRVQLVPAARFLEVKTPSGPPRDAQALRRARAYLQFLRHPLMVSAAAHGGPLDRLQVWAYHRLPTAAPWLVPLALGLLLLACALLLPTPWALAGALALIAAAASPVGRRLFDLLAVIRAAGRCEREAPLADRWETPRT